jgi:hypothetical protein
LFFRVVHFHCPKKIASWSLHLFTSMAVARLLAAIEWCGKKCCVTKGCHLSAPLATVCSIHWFRRCVLSLVFYWSYLVLDFLNVCICKLTPSKTPINGTCLPLQLYLNGRTLWLLQCFLIFISFWCVSINNVIKEIKLLYHPGHETDLSSPATAEFNTTGNVHIA